jgi:hypothetical protein
MRSYRLVVSYLCSLIIVRASPTLFTQHATGGVNGTVTDPTGAVVVGATVTLINQDTNVVSHATTNNSGYFVFLNVTPSPYILTISKTGFKGIELPTFNLVANQDPAVSRLKHRDRKVTTGQEGVMLQSSSSELGNVIPTQEIQQLPLNGRNFTSLLILSPGVTPVSTAQGSGISTTDAGITAIPGTAFY